MSNVESDVPSELNHVTLAFATDRPVCAVYDVGSGAAATKFDVIAVFTVVALYPPIVNDQVPGSIDCLYLALSIGNAYQYDDVTPQI